MTRTGWRILVLEPGVAAAGPLVSALRQSGFTVSSVGTLDAALESVRVRTPDAVVVAVPVLEAPNVAAFDVDLVSVCAALTEGPSPPTLILLDPADLAAQLPHLLPESRRPAAVLPRSIAPDKLVTELEAVLEWNDAALPPAEASPSEPRLPQLLRDLASRKETGVLEVRAGGICTRIHIRQGSPVFAEGGSLRETLGRALLRRGAICEEQYLRVIERMTERLIENETIRMGEVLVELGLLTPQEVFDALTDQVREKIIDCFQWTRFAHAFEPLEDLPDDVLSYRCPPVEALMLQGVRAHYGPERLESVLAPHAARHPWVCEAVEVAIARVGMSPAETRWARGLDGTRTTHVVVTQGGLDELQAGQVLAALWLSGLVGFSEAPRKKEAVSSRSAETFEHTAAAASLRPRTLVSRDSRTNLDRLRRTLARDRGPAAAQSDRSAQLEAEGHYRHGVRLLAQGLMPGALRLFRQACELSPEQPEYHMYRSWLEHRTARDEQARTLTRSKAAAAAQRVLESDARCLRAYTILGELAPATGDSVVAERWFRLALRIDPDDREAQRGMRLLTHR